MRTKVGFQMSTISLMKRAFLKRIFASNVERLDTGPVSAMSKREQLALLVYTHFKCMWENRRMSRNELKSTDKGLGPLFWAGAASCKSKQSQAGPTKIWSLDTHSDVSQRNNRCKRLDVHDVITQREASAGCLWANM